MFYWNTLLDGSLNKQNLQTPSPPLDISEHAVADIHTQTHTHTHIYKYTNWSCVRKSLLQTNLLCTIHSDGRSVIPAYIWRSDSAELRWNVCRCQCRHFIVFGSSLKYNITLVTKILPPSFIHTPLAKTKAHKGWIYIYSIRLKIITSTVRWRPGEEYIYI